MACRRAISRQGSGPLFYLTRLQIKTALVPAASDGAVISHLAIVQRKHQVGASVVDGMKPVRRTNEEEIELLEFDDLARADGQFGLVENAHPVQAGISVPRIVWLLDLGVEGLRGRWSQSHDLV